MFRRKKDEIEGPRPVIPSSSSAPSSSPGLAPPKPPLRPSMPSTPAPMQGINPPSPPKPMAAPATATAPPSPPSAAAPVRRPPDLPLTSGGRVSATDNEPKKLIVGREIFLSGQITSCDRLIVEGRVEAQLTQSKMIEVTESGYFKGSADIEDADIAGRFEGTLNARGKVLIRATGRLTGQVVYGQIEIEAGGEISGEIHVAGSDAEPAPLKSFGDSGRPSLDRPDEPAAAPERVFAAAGGEMGRS